MTTTLYQLMLGVIWTMTVNHPVAAEKIDEHVEPRPAMHSLIEKVNSQGAVRVNISLNAPFVPEGKLPDQAAVENQRNTIAAMQTALLEKLRDCKVESVMRSRFTPSLSMEVDACGVAILSEAPEVLQVAEDRLVPPMHGETTLNSTRPGVPDPH